MASPVSVEFFKQFTEKEIDEKQFIQKLSSLTVDLQKKKVPTIEQIAIIGEYSQNISDETYSLNVELFLKFALYLSDRGIYKVFENYNCDFESINLASGQISSNIVSLYLIKRIYHSENHKYILVFLNGVLREQKQIEKKFILLEIYTKILPQLEKREIHFREILPLILIVIKEALDKYLRYRQQQNDGTLNKENEYVKIFMNNFQQWTVSFFKRIFDCLKKTPEIKANQQQQVIKDLMSINDLYDYDPIQDQVFKKAEKPILSVKHLILLFIFDLFEGIIEVRQSMTSSHLDPKIIQELHDLTMGLLNEIHSNKLELIQNYLQTIRFFIQREQTIKRRYHIYEFDLPYNPVGVAYLTYYVLFENHPDNRNIEKILSDLEKLKLSIGVLYEQRYFLEAKCNTYLTLVKQIAILLSQTSQQFKPINQMSYFITPIQKIILELLEKAGSGLQKEEEQLYIKAWKNLTSSITLECYTGVIFESLNESQNFPLLSHLINHYRSLISQSIKEKKSSAEETFKFVNKIHGGVNKKLDSGTIDTKIQIVDSLVLLEKVLFLNFPRNDNQVAQEKFKDWSKDWKVYEKNMQQALEYLNVKKKEKEVQIEQNKEKGDQQDDMVYYQMLSQENLLQIAYYNIQDLSSLQ